MPNPSDANIYGTRTQLSKDQTFCFTCHPGVPCFTRCCHNTDMYLYPYDIIRLKNRLNMTSDAFLDRHTVTAVRENPYFPHVMLKMADTAKKPCPFLSDQGCTVYEDRPFSCRAYPLEPAVSRQPGHEGETLFFIVRHPYCEGHETDNALTVAEWIADQEMEPFLENNAAWVAVDSILRNNPWGDSGVQSPALKMAFMACFNVDAFREFVFTSSFLERFAIAQDRLDAMRADDKALLLFGFDWVRFLLTNGGPVAAMKR
ncbi:MAG: YkgJ family cysteine cluster protein [Thermodesulfobacteriota bacterium]